jgi:tetratricopeptide (TPR) repeat protein
MVMDAFNLGQRERERKIVEIVRNFLLATRTFRQCHEKYRQSSLRFSDLVKLVDDRGQSILFSLKESCHALFRRGDSTISEKEVIFDLTIGTLFHLAMKMREDLYQLEFYGPKYTELSEKEAGSPGERRLVHELKVLIYRAQNSFKEGMEEMALLLKEMSPHFKEFLREHRENGLLIRFFLEEKSLFRESWAEGSLEDLFQSLYGPDSSQPHLLAGESYFQSALYAQASQAFSRALERSPADENLQFMFHLSQGMEQFYSFAPVQALNSLEKGLSLGVRRELLERYRDAIQTVCQRIQAEIPGRRKSDPQQEVVKKAKALQQQLEKIGFP